MSQPSQFANGVKVAKAVWLALFGLVLVFVVGVVIWALAGPVVFVVVVGVLVALPLYVLGHRRR